MPNSNRSSKPVVSHRSCLWHERWLLAALLLTSYGAEAVQLPVELLAPLSMQLRSPGHLPGLEDLRLHGVFSSGDGRGSGTLSIGNSGPVQVKPGDHLPQGIEVKAVLSDRLLLQRGSQLGILRVQGAGTGAQSLPETTPELPQENGPLLSPSCAPFLLQGVPLDELQALGDCPKPPASDHG